MILGHKTEGKTAPKSLDPHLDIKALEEKKAESVCGKWGGGGHRIFALELTDHMFLNNFVSSISPFSPFLKLKSKDLKSRQILQTKGITSWGFFQF